MEKTNRTEERCFMERCLQLAALGNGYVSPNPMVGAVIVHAGRIIGEGYHCRFGGSHAEVNAVASVREPGLLSESTLYVSLEPCSHHGKTPPCTELILRHRIPRVVVGCPDPFEAVSGRGIACLRDAGVTVEVGLLQKACEALNRRFIVAQREQRPYVLLKWAQSADGFLDVVRTSPEMPPVRISTPETARLVHRLRAGCDAVLVGTDTARLDDPALTVRGWSGRAPLRVVLDRTLRLPASLRLFSDRGKTLVFTERDAVSAGSVAYERVPDWSRLFETLFARLRERNVGTLLVEGGAGLLRSLIECGCWDEARIETGPVVLKNGVPAPRLAGGRPVASVLYGASRIDTWERDSFPGRIEKPL